MTSLPTHETELPTMPLDSIQPSASGDESTRSHASDISIRGVVKTYGPVRALNGVDLDIRSGEFMTLLGPSGSGKTTLLNIIQGFEAPNSGAVHFAGRDIVSLAPSQRGFGMVFQSYALFPHMTVAENVAYPLRARGVDRSRRREMVDAALRQVELEGYGERRPHQLSGGQQQRVALARAIVFQPPVLLMDEPLAALDRRLRQALQLSLKELHSRINATILYVTHDQEEALVMSDRICVMHEGEIVQVGTPKEVYTRPSTAFVASFLGETNLLSGKVVEQGAKDSRVALDLQPGHVVEVPGSWNFGEDVILSVRPEDVLLVGRSEGQETEAGIAASVKSCVFVGDAWRVVSVGGESGVPVIAKRGAFEGPVDVDGPVRVGFRAGSATVFKEVPG